MSSQIRIRKNRKRPTPYDRPLGSPTKALRIEGLVETYDEIRLAWLDTVKKNKPTYVQKSSIWDTTEKEWRAEVVSSFKRKKQEDDKERKRRVTTYLVTINPNAKNRPSISSGDVTISYAERVRQYKEAVRKIMLDARKDLDEAIRTSLAYVSEEGDRYLDNKETEKYIDSVEIKSKDQRGSKHHKEHIHTVVAVRHRTRLQLDYDRLNERVDEVLKYHAHLYAHESGNKNFFKDDLFKIEGDKGGGKGGPFSHPPRVHAQFVRNSGSAVEDYVEKSDDEEF